MNGGSTVLDAQLRALRAQCVGIVAFLDLLLTPDEPPPASPSAPPICPHPDSENIGTMGNPQRYCRYCRTVFQPQPTKTSPPMEETVP